MFTGLLGNQWLIGERIRGQKSTETARFSYHNNRQLQRHLCNGTCEMNVAISSESSNVYGIKVRRRARSVSRCSLNRRNSCFLYQSPLSFFSRRLRNNKAPLRVRVQQYFPELASVIIPLLSCPLFMHHPNPDSLSTRYSVFLEQQKSPF